MGNVTAKCIHCKYNNNNIKVKIKKKALWYINSISAGWVGNTIQVELE